MIGAPRAVFAGGSGQRDPLFSKVSLLLHFDNSLVDSSTTAVSFSTSGTAALSSTQSRYGGYSLSTTGPSNGTSYTTSTNTTALSFTGDFTIELWCYYTTSGAGGNIVDTRKTTGGGYRQQIRVNTSNQLVYIPYLNSAAITTVTSSGSIPVNSWCHIAFVRASGVVSMFINGTKNTVTYSDSNSYTAEGITLGATGYTLGFENFPGYFDDIRATKYARYTSNFTPPALPFPNF